MSINLGNQHSTPISAQFLNRSNQDCERNIAKIPSYAHLIFHLTLTNQTCLTETWYNFIKEIKIDRLKISQQNPDDIENWLLLSQIHELLGDLDESSNNLEEVFTRWESPLLSKQLQKKLVPQANRQKASLLMSCKDYIQAREIINKLFDEDNLSPQNFALRAALELHEALATPSDLIKVVKHYTAAVEDLETAISENPIVISKNSTAVRLNSVVVKTCLKLFKKQLVASEAALRRKQALISNALYDFNSSQTQELNSIVVRVDLAAGFGSHHTPISLSLPFIANELRKIFFGKLLTLNHLENGFQFPFLTSFLVYKILHASVRECFSKRFSGIFTTQTNMTLIPGQEILSRSQSSLLYSIGCKDIFGQFWADKLGQGVCFGGTITWMLNEFNDKGADYFDQMDKAVRHIWDEEVKSLFRNIMIIQCKSICGLKNWHIDTDLACWQNSVIICDKNLLFKYFIQLSNHDSTISILCTGGDRNKRHTTAAVIHPLKLNNSEKSVFAHYYDFNEEMGAIIAKSVWDLAKSITLTFKTSDSITIQVYGNGCKNPPSLSSNEYWIKEMGPLPQDLLDHILLFVEELNDENLNHAWSSQLMLRYK